MPTRRQILTALCSSFILRSEEANPADPWPKQDLLDTSALAAEMKSGKTPKIIFVGFPVLYRNRHIAGAILAGPASKPEGLAQLRTILEPLPKDAPIVIYCGCCPFAKCPNIRPAFKALDSLGFTRVRVLFIPENLHSDWVAKGFPVEPA